MKSVLRVSVQVVVPVTCNWLTLFANAIQPVARVVLSHRIIYVGSDLEHFISEVS